MTDSNEAIIRQLKQQEEDLDDVGLRSNRVSRFLTILLATQGIDLPYKGKAMAAADKFLYSYHTGDSPALQQVRSDELLTEIFNGIHASKIEMMPVYEKELAWQAAGLLDEEDVAMTETLGRRLKGLEVSIHRIAEMRENSDKGFEMIKAAANTAKNIEQEAGLEQQSKATAFNLT